MTLPVSGTPREWNVWELERLARANSGGDMAKRRRALVPARLPARVRDSRGNPVGGLRRPRARVVRPAARGPVIRHGLARRGLALAAVALLGGVLAFAADSWGGEDTGSTQPEARPVPVPGSGWYRALAAPYPASTTRARTSCGQRLGPETLGVAHPGLAVRREALHLVRRQARPDPGRRPRARRPGARLRPHARACREARPGGHAADPLALRALASMRGPRLLAHDLVRPRGESDLSLKNQHR